MQFNLSLFVLEDALRHVLLLGAVLRHLGLTVIHADMLGLGVLDVVPTQDPLLPNLQLGRAVYLRGVHQNLSERVLIVLDVLTLAVLLGQHTLVLVINRRCQSLHLFEQAKVLVWGFLKILRLENGMTHLVAPFVHFFVQTAVYQTRGFGVVPARVVLARGVKEVVHLGLAHHV